VALTVNLIYETGIGNDEMNGGNWKIDIRSVEYRYIERSTNINFQEIIADIIRIHESNAAINQDRKYSSRQAS